MKTSFAEEALEVGAVLHDSIRSAGGVTLLRRAVADEAVRAEAEALFSPIGVWDLNPLSEQLELEVAAIAAQAAGYYAVPYPVVARLSGQGKALVALVDGSKRVLVPHGGLDAEWAGVGLGGQRYRLTEPGSPLGTRLAPFSSWMHAEAFGERDSPGAALAVTLQSFWLLGLLENATQATLRYTREREQFGRPLIAFQSASFRLAEMAVSVEALTELAKFTLWRIATDPRDALVDALALQLAMQTDASIVLRSAHQLHGAMGFTDEVDISWLSLASQHALRVPAGRHAMAGQLLCAVERDGWPELGQVQ